MASEINLQSRLSFAKGGATTGMDAAVSVTFAGTKYRAGRQSIGFVAEELININEVTPGGYIFVKNLGPTNYVQIGRGGVPTIRVNAGEFALFRIHQAATNLTAQADTADVDIEFLVLDA